MLKKLNNPQHKDILVIDILKPFDKGDVTKLLYLEIYYLLEGEISAKEVKIWIASNGDLDLLAALNKQLRTKDMIIK